jgi:phosphoglucosamine mutase
MAQCIFSELGAQVQIINNHPDGYNINANCGATDTTSLQKEVIESHSDLGIAFDGDGDRLIMVDSQGNVVDGDQIVFIIAKKWMQDNRLTNNIVVGTKMTNLGIRLALSELGITFIEANVGDRYVMEQMQKYNGALGGEGSGHIICADNTSSGDGIISALQILEVIASTGRTLDDLCQDFTIFPQTLINISLPENFDLDAHEILKTRVAEVEKKLDKAGRVLIRKSGTEPLLRIMVEGSDQLLVEESANYLAESIS